ncbi:S8 family serine peptidase [Candidatus Poribacteria bacterium]|nr:S8 family serine peptidase [Candidatus Poribacteria bacterium]
MTPKARAEWERLHAKSPLQKLHNQMGVRSIYPLFPHIAHPGANPNLKRTYLLRFQIPVDLHAIKSVYAAHPLIEASEFNYIRQTQASEIIPNDPRFEEQWNLSLIETPGAWAIEKGDPEVIIAVVDTGFDYTHEDLASQTWVNAGEIPDNGIDDDNNGYIDDVRGWDFSEPPSSDGSGKTQNGDNDPIDESGHGTHVTGIIGAAVDNDVGIAGVAWNCTLMPIRGAGVEGIRDDRSAAAIVYAVDNGARVINMSWGGRERSFVLRDAVDYAYARGVLMIAASGNESENASIFPAGYRKVISVAATEQHKQKFYQSNFGASIDIGAPGNVIVSTQINNRYRPLSGTSMATAHVSGVAALIMSKRPSLTHQEVRQILISTADPITESPELVGAGNLNAARALMASSSLKAHILLPEAHTGGSNQIEIVGTAGGFKFDTWQLLYGPSAVPTAFQPIDTPSQQQKRDETLLVWETSAVPEGIYTVRLEVNSIEGKVLRDEVVISVDRTPPQVQNVKVRNQITKGDYATVVSWSTDDFTINTLSQRAREAAAPFRPIEENSASREHFFTLSLDTGSYDLFITSRNDVGLETLDNNGGKFYRAEVIDKTISPNGFVETSTTLPPMHLGSVTADMDRDGLLEIVGLPITNDAASGIEVHERTSAGIYELQHTSTINAKPIAVDDTDGDGLLEILVNTRGGLFLYESVTRNGYPEKIIWETTFLASGQIVDLDNDGRKEIVGADNFNDNIRIFENRGNDSYDEILVIRNETEGSNVFGEQFAIGDFDANGVVELIVGDSEGELFIYESIGDDLLVEKWRTKLDVERTHQLTAGDLTGDGIPEFVVGGTVKAEYLPSMRPRWEYHVFTAFPPVGTNPQTGTGGGSRYQSIWSQAITPSNLKGNSLGIGDVDGDSQNELVILANPSVYVFKWSDGMEEDRLSSKLTPVWHHEVGETPRLFLVDLNQDNFSELYLNSDANLLTFTHVRASDPNSVVNIQPYELSATPLSARAVRIDWETQEEAVSYTIYRAVGDPDKAPSHFEAIAKDLDFVGFLDRKVTKDVTYWYTVSAKNEAGVESAHSKPVSVTPSTPPELIAAKYIQDNQVAVTYDKQMGASIGNSRLYLLREPKQLAGTNPISVIRDRMGTRAMLTFREADLVPGRTYEITVSDVRDTDRNPINLLEATQTFDVPLETQFENFQDFSKARVYPNPIRPNEFHKSAVTFDRLPTGTTIEIYNTNGERLDGLTVTTSDAGRTEWLLLNHVATEVTSGIYIYVMEFEDLKKTGKIAVIK